MTHFDVVIERDDAGYFVGSIPALPGCHTQAKSLDTLMIRIKEAAQLCIEMTTEPLVHTEFMGVQRIALAA